MTAPGPVTALTFDVQTGQPTWTAPAGDPAAVSFLETLTDVSPAPVVQEPPFTTSSEGLHPVGLPTTPGHTYTLTVIAVDADGNQGPAVTTDPQLCLSVDTAAPTATTWDPATLTLGWVPADTPGTSEPAAWALEIFPPMQPIPGSNASRTEIVADGTSTVLDPTRFLAGITYTVKINGYQVAGAQSAVTYLSLPAAPTTNPPGYTVGLPPDTLGVDAGGGRVSLDGDGRWSVEAWEPFTPETDPDDQQLAGIPGVQPDPRAKPKNAQINMTVWVKNTDSTARNSSAEQWAANRSLFERLFQVGETVTLTSTMGDGTVRTAQARVLAAWGFERQAPGIDKVSLTLDVPSGQWRDANTGSTTITANGGTMELTHLAGGTARVFDQVVTFQPTVQFTWAEVGTADGYRLRYVDSATVPAPNTVIIDTTPGHESLSGTHSNLQFSNIVYGASAGEEFLSVKPTQDGLYYLNFGLEGSSDVTVTVSGRRAWWIA